MKFTLLLLVTTFAVYGSAQENVVINVKQVVAGCASGGSCGSAPETGEGSSQDVAEANNKEAPASETEGGPQTEGEAPASETEGGSQPEGAPATTAAPATTTAPTTTTSPATTTTTTGPPLECNFANTSTKYANGTDIMLAICSNGQWAVKPSDSWLTDIHCIEYNIDGVYTFDGYGFNLGTPCSYDMVYVAGETTVSVEIGSNDVIENMKLFNADDNPLTCIYINKVWNCSFTPGDTFALVPGYDMYYTAIPGELYLLSWNGIMVTLGNGGYIYVSVADFYNRTKLKGLCGNFNGVRSDDLLLRDDSTAIYEFQFISDWQSVGQDCVGK